MHVRLAALAAWLLLSAAATPATAEELMTLDDAFARVAQTHPELRLVDARATVLAAERDQAVQRPPWTLGAEVENALGTGAAQVLRQRPVRKDEDPTVGAALALPKVHRRQSVARLPPVMPEHGGGELLHVRGHIPWSDEVDAIVSGDLAIA